MVWRGILAAMVFLTWAGVAAPIDRIVLQIGEVATPVARLSGATVQLDLTREAPTVTVKTQRLVLHQPRAAFTELSIACSQLLIREPQFACRSARLAATGGPTRSIDMQAAAGYDTTRKVLTFSGSGLAIAGGRLRFDGKIDAAGWTVQGRAEALQVPQLRKLAAPWVSLPAAYSIDGRVGADLRASGRRGALQLRLDGRTADLNFTNEAGTIVAEKLDTRLRAQARQTRQGLEIETTIDSGSGQALAGPVLLDFAANPLRLLAHGLMAEHSVVLDSISITQRDLLAAQAQARVQLGAKPSIVQARADITRVQFPAAYTSFLQIALAATDFGTLQATGTARGAIEIANDQLAQLDVHIDDLDLKDDKTHFVMSDLRGDLHWVPGTDATVEPSNLAWSKTHAYGLSGGTARLDFRARGFGFELIREARIPLFDGAVVVHSLAARGLGSAQAELDFDAHIEPISMALLSTAFGWPELSGHLAGRIPGLTYRNHVLELNGDLTANVFDGTVTGRNFRLRDPLGPWPRLFADVTARRLDLELVTSTFSIGSITGRLDADVRGLELFNWSPVAFDARLYSTRGDRSRRLISQKAVTSISSIGGGGGGVTKALQSGVLRFFDRFRYDRIGINCQLRNEVCLMTGVEPHGEGYYIVKGSGIPRIDIIGNAGRVDWPQLVTQIVQGMRSENVIVR